MLRRILLAAAVLLAAVANALAGGGPTSPDYVRIQQGAAAAGAPISCTSVTGVLKAASSDCRSISFLNSGAVPVFVCQAATCTTGAAHIYLRPGKSYTADKSCRSATYSCITSSSSGTVYVHEED